MSDLVQRFGAYRTVYGPNRTARNEIVHAVLVSDYDALLARCEAAEARLAEAERLLQECFDARATTPSIGLVYRVGHYLNHRNDATQEPTR